MTGCGVYTLNPRGKSDYKSIAIEPFNNTTPEYGLADRLTNIVTDAFIADGTFKVVSADLADVLLVATLARYERVPYQFDENDQVSSYKVMVGFDLALKSTKDQAEIWKESVTQEGIFSANDETEEVGQERAAQALVQTILSRTTRSW